MGDGSRDDRTVYVRNLDSKVTEEILFELFLQAGPLVSVKRPKDQDGKLRPFAFVEFQHDVSPPYARSLMDGIRLYGNNIGVQFRSGSKHDQDSRGNSPSATPPPYNRSGGQQSRAPNGFQSYPTPPLIQRTMSVPQDLLVGNRDVPSGFPVGMPNPLMMGNFLIPNFFPVDRDGMVSPQQMHQRPFSGLLDGPVAPQLQDRHDNSSHHHRHSSREHQQSYHSQGSEEEHSPRSHHRDDRHRGHSNSSRHEQHYRSDRRQHDDERRHGSMQRHQSYQPQRHERRDHPYKR